MKATFNNFQLLADKELYEAMVEKYGTQLYRNTGKIAIKTNNSFASFMIAEKVGDKYKITPITSQNNERQSLQMEAYWTVLKEFPINEFNDVPQFYRQWFVNRGLMKEEAERDYKDEYKKFQSSKKSKEYRAELNKYNRDKGTYGNGDGKDASHKNGKISGFEKSSTNKGRREKSRLKKESEINEKFPEDWQYDFHKIRARNVQVWDGDNLLKTDMPRKAAQRLVQARKAFIMTANSINLIGESKMKITRERLREIITEEYQKLNEQRISDEVATTLVKSKKIKKGMSEDDMMPIISAYVKKKYPKPAKRLLSYDRDFWADTISAIKYELK